MSYANPDALVSTEWLAARLSDPSVALLDGTWYLPGQGDPRADYEKAHIPGAAFFDIDAIADRATDLPHMLPDAETFARLVGALGVGNDSHVVVYDRQGVVSAARVWWEFRFFGHARVSVLDGGLPKWQAEGRPVESGVVTPKAKPYRAQPNPGLVRSLDQVRANLASRREQVLDARTAGRFSGTEPEPRPGCRSGHIPGSLNLPYAKLFDPARKTMADDAGLAAAFRSAGINLSRPVVTSCGSGITASVLALGLHLIGHRDFAVYDGSWSEWGTRTDTPVET
jgi:thiosulfate/3-mercaptopyruvate sulfurtransferase